MICSDGDAVFTFTLPTSRLSCVCRLIWAFFWFSCHRYHHSLARKSVNAGILTAMALSQPEAKKNLKRSPSNAGSHDPSQTKLRRIQTHHSLRHKSKAPIGQSSSLLDYTQYQDLLNRSIVLALEAVGFHAAKPLALQSFRALVEQCKLDTIACRPSSHL